MMKRNCPQLGETLYPGINGTHPCNTLVMAVLFRSCAVRRHLTNT